MFIVILLQSLVLLGLSFQKSLSLKLVSCVYMYTCMLFVGKKQFWQTDKIIPLSMIMELEIPI